MDDAEKKGLAVEVFELTGLALEASDPLIAAVMFYSAKLRTTLDQGLDQNRISLDAHVEESKRAFDMYMSKSIAASAEHQKTVNDAAMAKVIAAHTKMIEDISKSVAALEKAANDRQLATERTFAATMERVKAQAMGELSTFRKELIGLKTKLSAQLRRDAKPPPAPVKPTSVIGGIIIMSIAAAVAGAVWIDKSQLITAKEKVDLAMGSALERALPLLDQQTKDNLKAALEKK